MHFPTLLLFLAASLDLTTAYPISSSLHTLLPRARWPNPNLPVPTYTGTDPNNPNNITNPDPDPFATRPPELSPLSSNLRGKTVPVPNPGTSTGPIYFAHGPDRLVRSLHPRNLMRSLGALIARGEDLLSTGPKDLMFPTGEGVPANPKVVGRRGKDLLSTRPKELSIPGGIAPAGTMANELQFRPGDPAQFHTNERPDKARV